MLKITSINQEERFWQDTSVFIIETRSTYQIFGHVSFGSIHIDVNSSSNFVYLNYYRGEKFFCSFIEESVGLWG